mmetsp:Transcript_67829/g.201863  ORF Transcript_67829/g.201863 Transcript_67829/m.201863 type:complete len:447 (+) Transcript_67829:61-1401(+)
MKWRLLVAGICFIGLTANYASRANMGIVVAREGSLPVYDSRGVVLGAFLVGYACIQVPSGLLARALGARPVLLLSAGLLALCDGATAVLAYWGFWPLVLCRVGSGAGAGLFVPAMLQLVSRWVPPSEMASYMTCIVSGANVGPILAMTLSPGLVRARGAVAAFGFWATGIGCWALAVFFLVTSTPSEHGPCVRSYEAEFIERRTAAAAPAKAVSLAEILRHGSCWGIIAGQVGFDFGWQLLLNWLPAYLIQPGVGLDLAQYPLLAALPYLFGWLGAVFAGQAVDAALSWKALGLRRRHATKAAQLLGAGCGALFLLVSAAVPSPSIALVTVLAALFCYQWQMAGFVVSMMDICPSDAGTFMGVANTFSMLAGASAQPVLDAILESTGSWFAALGTAGLAAFVGAIIFAALTDDKAVSQASGPSTASGVEEAGQAWKEYSALARAEA